MLSNLLVVVVSKFHPPPWVFGLGFVLGTLSGLKTRCTRWKKDIADEVP